MQSRKKAADVFRDANLVFARKVSFVEAFPEIEDVVMEVEESGHGVHFSPYLPKRGRTYRKDSLGEYINCSNPICYNGGFRAGSIIREMVREHKTDHEDFNLCQGYEGSPKGRRQYRSCTNHFNIKVHIIYKREIVQD